MKIRVKKNNVIKEMSSMGAGGVQGAPKNAFEEKEDLKEEELDEMYSTSGAMMGSGSGQGPYERSPEGHKRYVRMRFTKQGLQNFKSNRYFAERKDENKNN